MNFTSAVFFAQRIKCGYLATDLNYAVGYFPSFCEDNDVASVSVFCVYPKVASVGDFKGQFVVLQIVFANQNYKFVHFVSNGLRGLVFVLSLRTFLSAPNDISSSSSSAISSFVEQSSMAGAMD